MTFEFEHLMGTTPPEWLVRGLAIACAVNFLHPSDLLEGGLETTTNPEMWVLHATLKTDWGRLSDTITHAYPEGLLVGFTEWLLDLRANHILHNHEEDSD